MKKILGLLLLVSFSEGAMAQYTSPREEYKKYFGITDKEKREIYNFYHGKTMSDLALPGETKTQMLYRMEFKRNLEKADDMDKQDIEFLRDFSDILEYIYLNSNSKKAIAKKAKEIVEGNNCYNSIIRNRKLGWNTGLFLSKWMAIIRPQYKSAVETSINYARNMKKLKNKDYINFDLTSCSYLDYN